MESHGVELYVYDLSMGLASQFSSHLIGKQLDGIWHTSTVVYNREYFFGSRGVESCNPASTFLGPPKDIKFLGETEVPYSVFSDYLAGLSNSTYSGDQYHLLHRNCNHFSEEIAQFLCGTSIPKHILDLPQEVLSSGIGATLPALISQLEQSARPISEEIQGFSRENTPDLNRQIEEARYNSFLLEQRRKTLNEKHAKKERKRKKKT